MTNFFKNLYFSVVTIFLVCIAAIGFAQSPVMPNKGYCPSGYSFSNGFCIPGKGAKDAVQPVERAKELYCPTGYQLDRFFCIKR